MPKRTTRTKPGQRKPKLKKGGLYDLANLIEYNSDDPISMGIFGLSGTGKTTVWNTFPKPTVALFCSGGLKNPGELKSLSKKDREGIVPFRIESTQQYQDIVGTLADDPMDFQTAVTDHISSLSDLEIASMMGIERAKPQKAWGDMTQQDWGKFGAKMKTILRDFIELPMNSVVVSQERIFEPPEDSDIGIAKAGPAVTPSVAQWLTAALDYSIQTFVREKKIEKTVKIRGKDKTKLIGTGEVEFCAYLPLAEDRMTKFRKPKGVKIDAIMVNPTYEKLIKLTED